MSKTNGTAPRAARPRVTFEAASLEAEVVADTSAALTEAFARDTSAAGICVADGWGLRIHVNRGALVVQDGVGERRRERRFDKATHALSRLVIIGTAGSVTLEALAWCRRLGVAVLVLAPDGTMFLASTPRMTDDARLRRMQASSVDLPVGADIARALIGQKLTAQAQLVASRFDDHDTGCAIAELATATDSSPTIGELRGIEATGAALYWRAWIGRPECVPRFAVKDRRRVPAHWCRYDGRRSVLASANGNKKAERPTNAMANNLYSLLEAEAVLACHVVGLDPGLGIVHNDTRSRHSLALDLMEPARPDVDQLVLDLLDCRTFRKVEFTETADGHCRLKPPLTHELAESLPQWSRKLAPIAERVAHTLGRTMAGKYEPATPLSRRRTRDAQAVVKARRTATKTAAEVEAPRQQPRSAAPPSRSSCIDCGAPVSSRFRVRCDACIGRDPGQTPEIRGRRAKAIASRRQASREWEAAHPGEAYDPDLFRREILPGLANVKLADIMAAAGLSKSFASRVRAGKSTPHVSTWKALAEVSGSSAEHLVAPPAT